MFTKERRGICEKERKTDSSLGFSAMKEKAVMTLPASSLKMQIKQSTKAFIVSGMAKGDSLQSVTSSNKKVLKVSGVKANGTCKLTAQKKTGKPTLTFRLASGLVKKVKVKVQKGKVKITVKSGSKKYKVTVTVK